MSELINENISIEKTSLFDFHYKNNAKIVSFGGYYLPINYSSGIIAEHNHTRLKASVFDVSHMGQIEINGPFVMEALEKIFPISFCKLAPGKIKYTQLLNHEGKIIDDLMIHKTRDENSVWLVVNAACKQKDISHLRHNLNKKFNINLRSDLSLIALQGPKSEKILADLIPEIKEMEFMSSSWFRYKNYEILISRCGYTGEDGFEISIPNKYVVTFTEKLLKNNDVKLAGLGARDSLRLEAGLCLYGHDIDIEKNPIEAGLKWSICKDRLDKQDFIGGQVIADEYKKGPQKNLLGFLPKGRAPAREGTLIYDASNKLIGEVTSGSFSPSLGVPISMGYIISSFKNEKEVFFDIRGKKIPADIIKLPFVPHNYFKRKKLMTDIFYTKDHEWIKVNGDEGVVGITSYASEQLGDIVFVELPEKGNSFDQGKDVAVIESVKAASEIYSPASGEIYETNSSLEEKPEIINEDPLERGWLYKVIIKNKDELKNLMSEEEYKKLIGV